MTDSSEFERALDEARGAEGTVLFVGGSRSGRLRAAQGIARDLGRSLTPVDVGKYIGETEKRLDAILEGAGAGAVLFFDEADALFGKRTEVKADHDRYADQEVSYQRVARRGGLTILSVSGEDRLLPAILRRIKHVVRFPADG